MISEDDRKTVVNLYQKGIARRRIARLVGIDIKTVRKIIDTGPHVHRCSRKDKIHVPEELLRRVYADCRGFVQRMHEILTEEYHLSLSYSTLRRLLQHYGIGVSQPRRSEHVADMPGEEMQHDTSEHWFEINGKKIKLICSGLYLRYSKMRYIKYYRRFSRFSMKCFIDEALRFWGYSAGRCIIDNTSLAIDYGSGSNAKFSNEMVVFARNYGFTWYAHAIGHANRKAGTERNFRTVETSFIPGRTFTSLADINHQALQWATIRYANRPQSKTGLIPSRLFEQEKASLVPLPEYIHPPYQNHQRIIDQYGYIAFNGNYYWVPSTRAAKVTVVQYANDIAIYDTAHHCLIKHPCFDELSTNQVSLQAGAAHKYPRSKRPNNIKYDYRHEQQELENIAPIVKEYVGFILSKHSGVAQKGKFIRQLHGIKNKTTPDLFVQALTRAHHYKITSIHQLYSVFSEILNQPICHDMDGESAGSYQQREEYLEGKFTQENDLDLASLSRNTGGPDE